MALLVLESFDVRQTTAELAQVFIGSVGVDTTATSPGGRTGSRCGRFDADNERLRFGFEADQHATVFTGFGAYFDGVTAETILVYFRGDSGVTDHVTIVNNGAGQIEVRRGNEAGTLLGTSTLPVTADIWYHVEIKVVLHDTTGTVLVKVNGVTYLNLTGQDTKNGGTDTTFDQVEFSRNGSNWYIDDLYIATAGGSAPIDLLGDLRIEVLQPTGNGNSSQLVGSDANSTDNYLLVDELPASSSDYVGSGTNNNKDTYAFGNLAVTSGVTVHGVQLNVNASKTDAGARNVALVTRSGGTDYDSADHAPSNGSYQWFRDLRTLNPNTSAAWTAAEVNSAEWGVKVRP